MPVSVCMLGALGMLAQAAFLREILATFRGGELTIGAALLFWLLWTAAGSGVIGRVSERLSRPDRWFHVLLPVYGALGYLGVIFTGSVPFIFRLVPGEPAPYDLQFLIVATAMLPFNVLGGLLFALGAKALERGKTPSAGPAFTAESLGAACGGILFSLVLVFILSNHAIASLVPIAACAVSAIRAFRSGTFRMLALLPVSILLLFGTASLDSRATGYPYQGQELIAQAETKYSRLRVTRRGEQVTFYSDASPLFSAPNLEASEHIAHIPMLAADTPRRVLVLGGGPGGVIPEILKYRTVERVTVIELDPGVFALADRCLEGRWRGDSRVWTVAADGRAFLARTGERFDVIVMRMPTPLSGLANRYYTREFFRLAAARLVPGGIFAFSLEGAENYISPDLAFFLSSVRATLSVTFPSVAVIPGTDARFLASDEPGRFDSLTWEEIERTRVSLGIETLYVRDYFLRYTMSPDRMELLRNSLDRVVKPVINTDTRPAGYFYRTVLQGNIDASRVIRRLKSLSRATVLLPILGIISILLIIPGILPGKRARARAVASTVLSMGMTEISLEVLAIMAYQSFFGFLYGRIALLTGAYMAGLALGGFIGTREVKRGEAEMPRLVLVQAGIALTALLWIALLLLGEGPFPFERVLEAAFYLLTAVSGLLGGIQFPIADHLYRNARHPGNAGGVVYGFDLAGSSIGALVTASLVIPVLGMYPALVWLAGVNFFAAGAVFLRR